MFFPSIVVDLLCFHFHRHPPVQELVGARHRRLPWPLLEVALILRNPSGYLLILFIYSETKKNDICVGIVILVPRGEIYMFVYAELECDSEGSDVEEEKGSGNESDAGSAHSGSAAGSAAESAAGSRNGSPAGSPASR